jgi:hypothetical protein
MYLDNGPYSSITFYAAGHSDHGARVAVRCCRPDFHRSYIVRGGHCSDVQVVDDENVTNGHGYYVLQIWRFRPEYAT